jgi:hypothetical protein
MSNRAAQLSPQASTRGAGDWFAVQGSRSPRASIRDIRFLRSWLEYDSQVNAARPRKGINWNAVLGVLVIVGVSAGFWTILGLIVAHFWK